MLPLRSRRPMLFTAVNMDNGLEMWLNYLKTSGIAGRLERKKPAVLRCHQGSNVRGRIPWPWEHGGARLCPQSRAGGLCPLHGTWVACPCLLSHEAVGAAAVPYCMGTLSRVSSTGWWPCGCVQEVTIGVVVVGLWPCMLAQEVTNGMSPVGWWHPRA